MAYHNTTIENKRELWVGKLTAFGGTLLGFDLWNIYVVENISHNIFYN
jgi:hypothetical protein